MSGEQRPNKKKNKGGAAPTLIARGVRLRQYQDTRR